MIFVIHNQDNKERSENIKKEFEKVGIHTYGIQPAIHDTSAKRGICKAHKSIVQKAKEQKWECVVIIEDDIRFTHPESFGIFMSLIQIVPEDTDILMAGLYQTGSFDNLNNTITRLKKVRDVAGFHCYCVFERAYDKFLEAPDNCHIDKWATGTRPDFGNLKTLCAHPFLAIQQDGFYSEHKNQVKDYSHLLKKYELYGMKLNY